MLGTLLEVLVDIISGARQVPLWLAAVVGLSLALVGGYKLHGWYLGRGHRGGPKQLPSAASPSGLNPGSDPITTEYSPAKAHAFYEAIAPHYDARNTESLLQTHREVIRVLSPLLRNGADRKVLDLGAGTGRLIAIHFYELETVAWVAVDSSTNMLARFQHTMSGSHAQCQTLHLEVSDALHRSTTGSVDVVVMSYLLSSMSEYPDFNHVRRVLKPYGHLIVADAHPMYVIGNDEYDFRLNDHIHVLHVRQLDLPELLRRIAAAGFRRCEDELIIRKAHREYSFVSVFEAPPSESTVLPRSVSPAVVSNPGGRSHTDAHSIATNWIVVSGPPSSGKTTIVAELSRLGYPTEPDQARRVIEERRVLGTPPSSSIAYQEKLQAEVLRRMLRVAERASADEMIVFDYGLPDNIAFADEYLGGRPSLVVQAAEQFRYRAVFLCAPLTMASDEVRIEAQEVQERLYGRMLAVYEELGYKVVELPAKSVQDRVLQITNYLSNLPSA